MASCDSFQQIFETSLPENPSIIESLSSWNPVQSTQPPSLAEIFGELHFNETPDSQSSLSFSFLSSPSTHLGIENEEKLKCINGGNSENKQSPLSYMGSDSFSPRSLESLQMCTEGLGFESFDDVEDLSEKEDTLKYPEKRKDVMHSPNDRYRRLKSFPPPISSIGSSGKPWVCYKSFRQDGRFVLKEVRVPTQEFMHACREDGRLKLHLVMPNDEFQDGEEGDSMTECEESADDENNEKGVQDEDVIPSNP